MTLIFTLLRTDIPKELGKPVTVLQVFQDKMWRNPDNFFTHSKPYLAKWLGAFYWRFTPATKTISKGVWFIDHTGEYIKAVLHKSETESNQIKNEWRCVRTSSYFSLRMLCINMISLNSNFWALFNWTITALLDPPCLNRLVCSFNSVSSKTFQFHSRLLTWRS